MGPSSAPDPSVAEVFITDELARRAPKKTNYLQEKLALRNLVDQMASRPDEVLPRFVALALEMTGGGCGGVSLYEPNPAPGIFRWHYLTGALSTFEGGTTPRDFSPCGITLDQNTPVLAAHPERVYTWIAEKNLAMPELLLVPLYLGGEAPLGTLWIVSDEQNHFDSGHARVMTELASFVGIALRMRQSEQRLRRALEEQATLAEEMRHRVNNLFTMTQGMIRISAKASKTKDEMALALSGRLRALASAHALVRCDINEAGSISSMSDLDAVIRAIVCSHESPGTGAVSRITLDGPSISCGDRATNGIALVFHELTTNAAKYGALSVDEGHLDVNWRLVEGTVVLRWVERGGPPIAAPPATKGFGSVLSETTIVQTLGGKLDHDWRPEGLLVTITVPAEALST